MPWDAKNYPAAFKSLEGDKKSKAIRQAEAIRSKCVADGGEEGRCSRIAIATALKNANSDTKAEELVYDDISFARAASLEEIKQNFDSSVLGIDVAIDINHDHRSGAAGWIKGLVVDESTTKPGSKALFAEVDWTDFGKEMIPRYRYISSEFGKFTDPETQKRTNNVLKAATLTNRPFVKGMSPVDVESGRIEILREGDFKHPLYGEINITAEDCETIIEEEGDNMNLEQIIATLQGAGIALEEGADLTNIADAIVKFVGEKDEAIADLNAKLEELQADDEGDTKLQETVNKLSDDVVKLTDENTKLQTKLFEQERDVFFSSMVKSGKLLPAEVEKFKKLYGKDKETVTDLLQNRTAVVDLEEHGEDSDDTLSLEDRLHAEAVRLSEEKGIPYKEAVLEASKKVN